VTDGWDSHSYYGRFARLTNASFAQHVRAFQGAFASHVAGVMPTYSIIQGPMPGGHSLEPVGAGYSRTLLTNVLRGSMKYRGMVVSDWGITQDCDAFCVDPKTPQPYSSIAMPWGVQKLTRQQRFTKGLLAGLDQFGGTDDVQYVIAAVRAGDVPIVRIDDAVRRVMAIKFRLGLFENPYVDVARAGKIVGALAFVRDAQAVQRSAQVLLKNDGALLPMRPAMRKVFLVGIDRKAAQENGLTVVDDPAIADFAIIRAATPYEQPHPNHFFGVRQHEGALDFRPGNPAYDALLRASAHVPTILAIFMDRPAVLTAVQPRATAILANFGASDQAILDVVLGRAVARGRLPFQLPSSMSDVVAQRSDLPDDLAKPLYPTGYGIMLRASATQ